MNHFERQNLIRTLSELPAVLFEQIVFALNPPGGILSPAKAPQGERAAELLNWAEKTGPGLNNLQEVLYEILGIDQPSQDSICPYKGLSYFDCNDEDYKYFYGREALTQTLLTRVAKSNFLAIVGASGSGKSSVLRAGLLQRLKDESRYEIRILLPGEHPLQNLARAFVDAKADRLNRAAQQASAETFINEGAKGLRHLIQTSDAKRVVLVIDQFEEAFTLCHNMAERQAFFETLLGALEATHSELYLILAMRSDFVGKCFEQHYAGLADKVQRHLEAVLPMTTDELTQAIKEPARQTGIALELGLAEALLEDVESSPGRLPLLQYTLTELWQRRQDNQLKLSTYHQLGGATGTLEQRANEVYDSLTSEQQQITRHILLSLTQLGEGSEDTRRRITQDSLFSSQYPEPQVAMVIKRLADANLVVTDERGEEVNGKRTAIVDVAHEALIRNWPKLRQWLEENRDLLRQQRRIELAAKEWGKQSKSKQNGYLLQGRQLADAQSFRRQHGQDFPLSQGAEKYLSRCLASRRSNRLKILGFGLIVPLGLAIYVGVQLVTYFRLRPHWDLIYSYDAESNRIGNTLLVRALVNINMEGHSLNRISLHSANLSDVNLYNADLIRADLRNAELSNAELGEANFRFANLSSTDLRNARFIRTILEGTDLSNADLSNAEFSDTILHGADLDSAILLSTNLRTTRELLQQQLMGERPPFLCNARLPESFDIEVDKDRDCDVLASVLMERYPGQFNSIAEAEAYVEEQRQRTWE